MSTTTKRSQRAQRLTPMAEFVKLFRSIEDARHDRSRVFSDFVEMASICISNQLSKDRRKWNEREKRYLQLIRSYDKRQDRDSLAQLLAIASVAFKAEGPHDFFGTLFTELELTSKWAGQFMTPFHVSHMMAKMTMQDIKEVVDKNGYVTGLDPCSGAGGMIAAMALAVSEEGLKYENVLHCTGVDVDPRCAHMSYITASLLGIPAVIYCGNSLTMEMSDSWLTPAHVLGGWSKRLAQSDETVDARGMRLLQQAVADGVPQVRVTEYGL